MQRFHKDDTGQDLIEYSLLLAFVALVAAFIFASFLDWSKSARWDVEKAPANTAEAWTAKFGDSCTIYLHTNGGIRLIDHKDSPQYQNGISHAVELVPEGSTMAVRDQAWESPGNGRITTTSEDIVLETCGSRYIFLPKLLREKFRGWQSIPSQ